MTNLTAKSNSSLYGHKFSHYVLFAEGYPYSFGSVYVTDAGKFKVSGLGREDRNWHQLDCPTFDTIPEALSFVRGAYETAMAGYHQNCAEIMAYINQGLSKVEQFDKRYNAEIQKVLVKIGRNFGKVRFTMILTIQEAITALDYLYSRSQDATVSIAGLIDGSQYTNEYRTSYAQWYIPVSSDDYHLCGYRSLEGVGRK